MGKDGGFLTPKAIANRIKAKGLQKLRWYCQMCEKQCRDENGFKCHCASEAHQRQMMLFAENPNKFLSDYTREFKSGFLRILSRSHGTKRVHCNVVYQEYIADRNHVHMNSTRWNSLSEFCKQLAREGIVEVDETEKGVFITWIDSSPEALARKEAIEKKARLEKSDEERNQRLLAEQIEKARATAPPPVTEEEQPTDLVRPENGEPLKMKLQLKVDPKSFSATKAAGPAVPKRPAWASANLGPSKADGAEKTDATGTGVGTGPTPSKASAPLTGAASIFGNRAFGKPASGVAGSASAQPAAKKMSALDEIVQRELKRREAPGGALFGAGSDKRVRH